MSAAAANLILRARLRDGVVEDVEIVSPRADPSPVFVGLTPDEAANMAGRLFSLCPAAQSLASRLAGEAAQGVVADLDEVRNRALRLLCERLGEMLRASLLDWPSDAPPPPADILHLRNALKMLRLLPQSDASIEAIDQLRIAAEGLGLGGEGGFLARQLVEAQEDDWELAAHAPDYLNAADDAAIFKAMSDDIHFSRAPALPGRCAETGAASRVGGSCGSLAARLAARRVDMAATFEAIGIRWKGSEAPDNLLAGKSLARGRGFAAVDSARGRLYHGLRLDGMGRIADYRIVAPTEWNFHPEGPFVRALRGARMGVLDKGGIKRRIERLAFVFDPCIRAKAEILDDRHA